MTLVPKSGEINDNLEEQPFISFKRFHYIVLNTTYLLRRCDIQMCNISG